MSDIKRFVARKKQSYIAAFVSQEELEKFDPIYAMTRWNALIYKLGNDQNIVGVAKVEKRFPVFTFDLFTENADEADGS